MVELTHSKPTVNDIARAAGVSLATVDRVLNGRPGVRPVTIEKVNRAVAQLGFVRDTAAANLARQRHYRLLFLLPEPDNEFIQALDTEIAAQSERLIYQRTQIERRTVSSLDPQPTVRALDALDSESTDGVAVFGPETPSVRDAVNRARDRGIAVASLISDLPSSNRQHFVGIDNMAAGRTAAVLMGRFVQRPGRVLVLTGSRLARVHLERRAGFDAVLTERFPRLEVTASIEGRNDPAHVRSILERMFAQHTDFVGIYSSAAGNRGLIDFLQSKAAPGKLVVIAHELTPTSRGAISRGVYDALISQDSGHIIRSAVRVLKSATDDEPIDPKQERIRTDIYLAENLPPV